MTTIEHQDDGNVRARSPWFKCYPQDWIEATRGLSLEQRAVYFDCLCIIYQFEKPLPADEKWMSHQLHISTRLWRSIRDALLDCGKLVKCDGGYTNARAQLEIGSRSDQRRTNSEIASNRERTKRENSENQNENSKTEPRNEHHAGARQIPDTDTERKIAAEQVDRPSAVAALPLSDLKALTDRLISSCNGALDNPVNCLGLLNISVPRMWLENGCDLERDVIPTLEAVGKRAHGKRIRTWDYFTGPVAEAKAKRLAGMPSVSLPEKQKPKTASVFAHPQRRDDEAEYAETLAWAQKMGLINEHAN